MLVAAIVVGSRNLQNFDPALVIYTFAVIFAAWGVIYHYSVWIQKPPTRVYWRSGVAAVLATRRDSQPGSSDCAECRHTFLAQTFIAKRSSPRWAMHQLIFWGCLLAVAITFPSGLRLDPLHQRSRRSNDVCDIPVRVSRVPLSPAHVHRGLLFHGLDISAFLVLGGIALALWRRMRDEGARAVQTVRHGLLAADPALRDLRNRARADRLADMAAREFLPLPRDPPRDHGDRRATLSCRSASSSTSSSVRRSSA